MTNTDGLFGESPAQGRYMFRLARAVVMLAFGAMMHLPSGTASGILPPTVSPRPFVRVAAQQADALDAPAVIVSHSLVLARLPATDGLLQAGDTTPNDVPVGTAGLSEPSRAVALVEHEPASETPASSLLLMDDDKRDTADLTDPPDIPKRAQPEKPLPAVASPPANDLAPLPQAAARPANLTLPSTSRVQPTVVAAARTVTEEERVRQLLDEYTGAFERRDIGAQKALYPNVDGKALKRAYEQITSQRLTLESCGITISGSTANARCRGSATFQPRIGTRPVLVASREWTFDLSKQDTAWRIVNTYVR